MAKGRRRERVVCLGFVRSPANPALRDITERVVLASKGRFDRALQQAKRSKLGLPSTVTISADEFLSATLDVWEFLPESAKRVNHPAPFPVALPERLIHLYTYENDLVVDPFLGSGTTLVAAQRTRRRGVGFDLDPAYIEIANQRLLSDEAQPIEPPVDLTKSIHEIVATMLTDAGFTITGRDVKVAKQGPIVAITANDKAAQPWHVDVCGAMTSARNGLHKTETAWRAAGRVHAISSQLGSSARILVVTSHLPKTNTEADFAVRSIGRERCVDVVELGAPDTPTRFRRYAEIQTGDPATFNNFWSLR